MPGRGQSLVDAAAAGADELLLDELLLDELDESDDEPVLDEPESAFPSEPDELDFFDADRLSVL